MVGMIEQTLEKEEVMKKLMQECKRLREENERLELENSFLSAELEITRNFKVEFNSDDSSVEEKNEEH
jgi:hypothetical protein